MSTQSSAPLLIVCMGVSGSGKTTLAAALAQKLGWVFMDADDFHSDTNINHMRAGKPLTNSMREPWLNDICTTLATANANSQYTVLAFSGLIKRHRDRIRALGMPCLFVYLEAKEGVIAQRMAARKNHFMPSSLLKSQLEALESPLQEPDVLFLDSTLSPHVLVETVLRNTKLG